MPDFNVLQRLSFASYLVAFFFLLPLSAPTLQLRIFIVICALPFFSLFSCSVSSFQHRLSFVSLSAVTPLHFPLTVSLDLTFISLYRRLSFIFPSSSHYIFRHTCPLSPLLPFSSFISLFSLTFHFNPCLISSFSLASFHPFLSPPCSFFFFTLLRSFLSFPHFLYLISPPSPFLAPIVTGFHRHNNHKHLPLSPGCITFYLHLFCAPRLSFVSRAWRHLILGFILPPSIALALHLPYATRHLSPSFDAPINF